LSINNVAAITAVGADKFGSSRANTWAQADNNDKFRFGSDLWRNLNKTMFKKNKRGTNYLARMAWASSLALGYRELYPFSSDLNSSTLICFFLFIYYNLLFYSIIYIMFIYSN
jgi:hypothetical protein